MPSADGQGPSNGETDGFRRAPSQSIELQLFESLVHHLIEKGILTKNDALSVVQTVAEVKRGQIETERVGSTAAAKELVALQRIYSSFEIVTERNGDPQDFDGEKILQLRPPLHGGKPRFPKDD